MSVVIAVAWTNFYRARRGEKPENYRRNFDFICHISTDLTISGFHSYILLFPVIGRYNCRHSPKHAIYEFILIEICRHKFAVRISILTVIVRDKTTSSFSSHMTVSGNDRAIIRLQTVSSNSP